MRKYGTVDEVDYNRGTWCPSNQGYAYTLRKDGARKVVYVNNRRELHDQIQKFIQEDNEKWHKHR